MKENKENTTPAVHITNLDHIKPCWYWDKKDLAHTPSQSEGLDPATEARYRREGARFIFDVGTRLGLYPFTLGTHTSRLKPVHIHPVLGQVGLLFYFYYQ